MKKITILFLLIVFSQIIWGSTVVRASRYKVLYVDSYHLGYPWSAGIMAGVNSVLADRPDIDLNIIHMDTKRHNSEEFKKTAALKAKGVIDSWQPDIVITSDDNASKYLIAPYFKNATLPFVFCGLNWDASIYGFPVRNVTGMVEVGLGRELLTHLRPLAQGERIGYLGPDNTSSRKDADHWQQSLGVKLSKIKFVQNMAQWQQAYLAMQKEVDMLILSAWQGIGDWQRDEMISFLAQNSTIPTGTLTDYIADYALLAFAKIPEEQGEWAATTALAILGGKSPGDIPLVTNTRARIIVNMKLAKAMGLTIPIELLNNAQLISAQQARLLYVNSYHKGYQWSDDIEKGLFKALGVRVRPNGSYDQSRSAVKLRVVRMDTKINRSEVLKKEAALRVKKIIEQWQPDIVVTSDDNAFKYLIAPYYKNSPIPFVFCGLNGEPSSYGLPYKNTTGMIEIKPVAATYKILRQFAGGDRVGFIGSNTPTGHKIMKHYQRVLGREFDSGKLVDTFKQFKDEYLRLQTEVDMLFFFSPYGIKDWNKETAITFIHRETKIPSGASSDFCIPYALLGQVGIAEEQGWWAGQAALKIIKGTSPDAIKVTTNTHNKLYLNMELAKALGIIFPMALVEQATFVDDE